MRWVLVVALLAAEGCDLTFGLHRKLSHEHEEQCVHCQQTDAGHPLHPHTGVSHHQLISRKHFDRRGQL